MNIEQRCVDSRGGLGCLDRKQGFIRGKLIGVSDHAAACSCRLSK